MRESKSQSDVLARQLNLVSATASLFSLGVGLCALAGWTFHNAILKSWLPGQVSVRINAAVCFLLLGYALWVLRKQTPDSAMGLSRRAAQIAAAIVTLVGVLALAENLLGLDLHIDQLLHLVRPGEEVGSARPGLIPFIASFNLVALGGALLILDWKTRRLGWPAQWLAMTAAVVSTFGLLDFTLGGHVSHTFIALPSAVNFALYSFGIVCARPRSAFGGLLSSQGMGARWLRRTAPAALAVFIFFGWILSKPMLTTAHFTWIEVCVIAIAAGMILFAFVAWAALLLERSEGQRNFAEQALNLESDELDRIVGRYEDAPVEAAVRRWSQAGIVMAVILTSLGFFGSWRSVRQSGQDEDWVAHTHAVIAVISRTLADCLDVEIGARGFAATGEDAFLEAYKRGTDALPEDLVNLASLTSDNAGQQQRVNQFRLQLGAKVETSARLIAERRRTGAVPAIGILLEGKHQTDVIRADLGKMQSEEAGLLAERLQTVDTARQKIKTIVLTGTVVGLVLLLLAGVITNREVTHAARMHGQLQALNSELERRVEERTSELGRSESRLRLALEAAHAATWEWDLETNRNVWSDELWKLYGLEPHSSEASYEAWRSILHPDNREETERVVNEAARAGSELSLEFRVLHRDGATRWLLSRGCPVRDADGRHARFVGVVMDITERKLAEEALQKSEEKYRMLFQSIVEGFCIVEVLFDEDVRPSDLLFIEINPSFETQTGLKNALGRRMREMAPQHEEGWFQILGKVALTGEPAHYENEAAQLHRWFEIYASRVGGPEERKVAIVFSDITTRKLSEKALFESEQRLRLFIEHAPAALAMFDRNMCYLCASRRWLSDYGMSGDPRGLSHYEAFPGPIPERWKEVHRRGLAGEVVRAESDLFERNDGIEQWIRWEVRPWHQPNGGIGGIVIFTEDITARKKAEEALQQSEERFQAMVNGIPQLAWMAEADGHIFWYNERWFEYTGTTLEQMEGWGWQRVHHPDALPKVMERWTASLEDGNPFDMEFPLRGADGRFRMFLTRILPLKNSEGRVVRWFGTNTDISELKKAEEALREREQRIRVLLGSTAEAIIGDDLEGNCTFCNPAALSVLGYEDQSSLLNRNLHTIMHHAHPDGTALSSEECELIQAVRAGHDYHSDEQYFWRKNGTCFPAECWCHPLFEDGKVTGSVLTFFDITDRKRAQEQVQENRARLGAALASMTDAVIISDNNGRFLNFNDRFATYYRFGNKAECPQTLDDFGHLLDVFLPDGEPAPREMWAVPRALRGETASNAEYGLRRKDTGETWVGSYSFGPIRDKEGSIVGSVVVARDITQQKANEREIRNLNEELEQRVTQRTAQLQAANKELEAFTYSVSHDLRAPLRHISGFSKLLVEEFGSALPPDAHHYLNRIQDGTLRMGLLVDDLLNLGRVGRQELHLQVAGLRSIVEEVIRDLQPECAGRQVEWKIGTLPFVECDPGLLKQVFQNLLANALKFTKPRATPVIEVGQQDNSDPPTIYVRDNGVGFSMKYADKLFGVFQRLHRQEDFEGTGVGLATVQRIVQKHGGRIWAEGALDKGATFYMTLGAASNDAAKSVSVGENT